MTKKFELLGGWVDVGVEWKPNGASQCGWSRSRWVARRRALRSHTSASLRSPLPPSTPCGWAGDGCVCRVTIE